MRFPTFSQKDESPGDDSDILAANWGLSGGASEKHYYYHQDGLGSVTASSDEAGNTIEKYEYSVYGDVQIVAKENGETRAVSIIDNPYYFVRLSEMCC